MARTIARSASVADEAVAEAFAESPLRRHEMMAAPAHAHTSATRIARALRWNRIGVRLSASKNKMAAPSIELLEFAHFPFRQR
jgi:hypothetical protein